MKNTILKNLGFLPDKRYRYYYNQELEITLLIPEKKITYEQVLRMVWSNGYAKGKQDGTMNKLMDIRIALGIPGKP